ncbi:prepilin peptidase [Nakamurella leprariae]|uniref:Prepilin peptidase n=1 Tax=Nakamurella leprariae TaxID=2803911 RepID=A0A938YEK3_9ACTN|nr:A24 family peptidase [Nakamurella leprariae]MBM9466987.1 prepilin peptidase [Nakamurella leprariae]
MPADASLVPALLAVPVGALAGLGVRRLLARLRRGAVVPPGPLELGGAGLAVASLLTAAGSVRLPAVAFAGLMLLALATVDLLHHRLPDALTGPAAAGAVVVVLGTELLAPGSGDLLTAVVCALVITGAFWLLARVAPRAMGLGDVKLMPSLALLTGYWSAGTALLGVVLGFVLGAAVAVGGVLLRRWRMGSAIAFGPWLLAGTWLVLAFPALSTAVV